LGSYILLVFLVVKIDLSMISLGHLLSINDYIFYLMTITLTFVKPIKIKWWLLAYVVVEDLMLLYALF
jgi:hypothetical protein